MSACGGNESSRYDMDIVRGKTAARVIRLEIAPFIYKPITAIAQSAPVLITAPTHVVPDGWRVAVLGVKGMRQINAKNTPPRDGDYFKATIVNGNQIQLNDVVSLDFTPYTSGGSLRYATPMDWTGYTARLDVRTRAGGTLLNTITNVNYIDIDTTKASVTFTFPASMTLTWADSYVWYELEMVSNDVEPVVIALAFGRIRVRDEVTTSV